jgi:hypothetical protein
MNPRFPAWLPALVAAGGCAAPGRSPAEPPAVQSVEPTFDLPACEHSPRGAPQVPPLLAPLVVDLSGGYAVSLQPVSRPDPIAEDAVSGPARRISPADPAAGMPRGTLPEIDAASVPTDPTLLPRIVTRWWAAPSRTGIPGPAVAVAAVLPSANVVAVYTDGGDRLRGLAASDGEELWVVEPSEYPPSGRGTDDFPPTRPPEALHDARCFGRLHAVERDGVLYDACGDLVMAVDLRSGTKLWETRVPGWPDGDAFVVGRTLVLQAVQWRRTHVPDDWYCMGWEGQERYQHDAMDAPPARYRSAVTVSALEATDGRLRWSAALLAVTPDHVAVVRVPLVDRGWGGVVVDPIAWDFTPPLERWGPQGRDPNAPGREIRVYRLGDGSLAGSIPDPGTLVRPAAWGDILVVPVGDFGRGVYAGLRLVAFRLPSLERVWEGSTAPTLVVEHQRGSRLLVRAGSRLQWIEMTDGTVAVEFDLETLMGYPGEPLSPEEAAACVAEVVAAGDSVAYRTSGDCPRRHLALLDAATLRPWRVLDWPEVPVERMVADPRLLLLDSPGGIEAVNASSEGRSLARSISPAELLERMAQAVARDEAAFERRARELAQHGEEMIAAATAAAQRWPGQRTLFALAILEHRPGPETIPAARAAFVQAQAERRTLGAGGLEWVAYGPSAVEERARRLIETLGGAQAVDEAQQEADRITALVAEDLPFAAGGLFLHDTPEQRALVVKVREARSRRVSPWRPPVALGTAGRLYDDAGLTEETAGLDTGGAGPTEALSADRSVGAVIAYAAGGASDLWLIDLERHGVEPLFTGVTSPYGLGIASVEPTDHGATVVVRRTTAAPMSALQLRFLAREEEVPVEATHTFRWEDLRRDRDRDGWTDLLEARFHTDAENADTDADTVPDPLDPAPRGSGPPLEDGCSGKAALTTAFFANWAGRDWNQPVFVVGPPEVNLQYEGYMGPVIYLTYDEASALQEEVGLDAATYVFLPGPDLVTIDADGEQATVPVEEFRGGLNAVGQEVRLRCVEERWYPESIRMTWVS